MHQVDENPSYGGPDCVKPMLAPVDAYDMVRDVSDASVFSVGAIVVGLRVGATEGSKFGIPVGDSVRCTTGPLLGSADGEAVLGEAVLGVPEPPHSATHASDEGGLDGSEDGLELATETE